MDDAFKYSPEEERLNVLSHALAASASLAACCAFVLSTSDSASCLRLAAKLTFGIALVILYATSTLYHASVFPSARRRLKAMDHAAIYILIAATYTPIALLVLRGTVGVILFTVLWSMAVLGVAFKMFFPPSSFQTVSTIIYVVMGWMVLPVVKMLYEHIAFAGFIWLFAGGFAYTLGAVLYSIDRIKYNHALFHALTVLGSICHFITIYLYI